MYVSSGIGDDFSGEVDWHSGFGEDLRESED